MSKPEKIERFFKNFLVAESDRIRNHLKTSFLSDKEHEKVLNKFQIFNDDNVKDAKVSSNINLDDVYHILSVILRHDLDYKSSTGKSVLDLWAKPRAAKNNAKSETCRESGNKLLENSKLSESVNQYNEAVLFAEFESKPYSLALANRSMAWIKLKERISFFHFEYQICHFYVINTAI